MRNKIYVHTPYIGDTGYNNHARDFFRHLSFISDIKVRNFTVGKSWSGLSDTPHEKEPYLNDIDRSILYEQVLWENDNTRKNFKIYTDVKKEFDTDVNLILADTYHNLFYDDYIGPTIVYNVWESTRQPDSFFSKLLEFDEMWVPSKWQKECTIEQGYDPNKIKVVPEGVDDSIFFYEEEKPYHPLTSGNRFTFFIAGRWDYRKSTKELLETFIKTFKKDEPVDLILSIDNPWGKRMDGFEETEKRLEFYGLIDDRFKILHFPNRDEYINLLKSCDVFLSCARSEGWNLPLIEAMACGTPAIYSNCSGQLEFAEGKGIPINILGKKSTNNNTYSRFSTGYDEEQIPGEYYEPDFNHLSEMMREVYENYKSYKEKAIKESEIIRNNFNWNKIALIGDQVLSEFIKNKQKSKNLNNKIEISYFEGVKVEIKGNVYKKYFIEFIDDKTNEVKYSSNITNNMWTSPSIKYYIPWKIRIDGVVHEVFSLKDKKVLINLDSKSLGDTVAWAPYAIEFMKKNECKVILNTFHNDWFKNLEEYKNIDFVSPGQPVNYDVSYSIGWYYDNSKEPTLPNIIPLQQTAANILGLEYKEIHSKIDFTPKENPVGKKYITIAPESTAGLKMWNNKDGWVNLVKYIKSLGYEVYNVSFAGPEIEGAHRIKDTSIPNTLNYIYHSHIFIGLSSGLSWLSWAIGKHVVMISNFTEEGHEFTSNCTRINNKSVCNSCWNNPNFKFDKGDWYWCPIWKNLPRQFECHKSITSEMVIEKIKNLL